MGAFCPSACPGREWRSTNETVTIEHSAGIPVRNRHMAYLRLLRRALRDHGAHRAAGRPDLQGQVSGGGQDWQRGLVSTETNLRRGQLRRVGSRLTQAMAGKGVSPLGYSRWTVMATPGQIPWLPVGQAS